MLLKLVKLNPPTDRLPKLHIRKFREKCPIIFSKKCGPPMFPSLWTLPVFLWELILFNLYIFNIPSFLWTIHIPIPAFHEDLLFGLYLMTSWRFELTISRILIFCDIHPTIGGPFVNRIWGLFNFQLFYSAPNYSRINNW